jgi:hypothetical protein
VRGRVAWVAGAALGAAGVAYRALRHRGQEPAGDPRAAELRRKLDESKELAAEREEFEARETAVDQVETSVDEKRAAVHERGRAAAEEMRPSSSE